MATRFKCPHCGRSGKVSDELVGHLVRCDRCKKPFRVEWPDAAHESIAIPTPAEPRPDATKESTAKNAGLIAIGCLTMAVLVIGPFAVLIWLIAATAHSGTWWVIGLNYVFFFSLTVLVVHSFSDWLSHPFAILFALLTPMEEGGGPLLTGASCLGFALNVFLIIAACIWWFQRDYRTEHVIALVNWKPTPAVAYYRRFSDKPFRIEPIRKKRP